MGAIDALDFLRIGYDRVGLVDLAFSVGRARHGDLGGSRTLEGDLCTGETRRKRRPNRRWRSGGL